MWACHSACLLHPAIFIYLWASQKFNFWGPNIACRQDQFLANTGGFIINLTKFLGVQINSNLLTSSLVPLYISTYFPLLSIHVEPLFINLHCPCSSSAQNLYQIKNKSGLKKKQFSKKTIALKEGGYCYRWRGLLQQGESPDHEVCKQIKVKQKRAFLLWRGINQARKRQAWESGMSR